MSENVFPVLLCGGSGTRLWPLSRKSYPKQFARLIGEQSLFQDAVNRLDGEEFAKPVIVTGEDFRFIVTEQLAAVRTAAHSILIEPEARNTAAAILAATLAVGRQERDALILVCPSDHVIRDDNAFRESVRAALPAARKGKIVTFGIVPDRPETGYGWLELEGALSGQHKSPVPLVRFVEKPDIERAKAMFEGGRHLWNAGIFLFAAQTLIDAFQRYQPAILEQVLMSLDGAETDLSFTRLAAAPWSKVDNISIDYAIMEKADNLVVQPFSGGWSDLGGWEAVWREAGPDSDGVVRRGNALAIECRNSLLQTSQDGIHLVGIGLEDIFAVAMPDAVLIADRKRGQDVRLAVSALKEMSAPQAETFPQTFRPWGWIETLVSGPRFRVNRIVVQPGRQLSSQSHFHRAEHWIVVEGTARVTIDGNERLVTENQSVYVPVGTQHRLENPGRLPLTLIEVQSGTYLGDDDTVRLPAENVSAN